MGRLGTKIIWGGCFQVAFPMFVKKTQMNVYYKYYIHIHITYITWNKEGNVRDAKQQPPSLFFISVKFGIYMLSAE